MSQTPFQPYLVHASTAFDADIKATALIRSGRPQILYDRQHRPLGPLETRPYAGNKPTPK